MILMYIQGEKHCSGVYPTASPILMCKGYWGFLSKCRSWFRRSVWDPRFCTCNKCPGEAEAARRGTVDSGAGQHTHYLQKSPKWLLSNCDLATRSLGWEACLYPGPTGQKEKALKSIMLFSRWSGLSGRSEVAHVGSQWIQLCWAGEWRQGLARAAFAARRKGSKTSK